MNAIFPALSVVFLTVAATAADVKPVYHDLVETGVMMSHGTKVKLPPPLLADGLDADKQQAAMASLCDVRTPLADVLKKSSSAPVITKVRTVNRGEGETPSVRAIDVWFVAYGDWDTLNSKEFLDSLAKRDEEGKNNVVSKSGILTHEELSKRQGLDLLVPLSDNPPTPDWRFVYSTFSLFDRVEISSTRFVLITRDQFVSRDQLMTHNKESFSAAAEICSEFTNDEEHPNQWRLMLRDDRAEIKLGPPHPYTQAGGYAKITRLKQPEDAIFVEFHLVYEEPYEWFDGANLIKQKAPLMVQEKVRGFRSKLANASQKKP